MALGTAFRDGTAGAGSTSIMRSNVPLIKAIAQLIEAFPAIQGTGCITIRSNCLRSASCLDGAWRGWPIVQAGGGVPASALRAHTGMHRPATPSSKVRTFESGAGMFLPVWELVLIILAGAIVGAFFGAWTMMLYIGKGIRQ